MVLSLLAASLPSLLTERPEHLTTFGPDVPQAFRHPFDSELNSAHASHAIISHRSAHLDEAVIIETDRARAVRTRVSGDVSLNVVETSCSIYVDGLQA